MPSSASRSLKDLKVNLNIVLFCKEEFVGVSENERIKPRDSQINYRELAGKLYLVAGGKNYYQNIIKQVA